VCSFFTLKYISLHQTREKECSIIPPRHSISTEPPYHDLGHHSNIWQDAMQDCDGMADLTRSHLRPIVNVC
jgi:hypothetical protein